jgi:ketosteroid isomerase-like protein
MTQPVDLVRDHFELANRGEYVAAGEMFSADVELVVPMSLFLNGGVFRGHKPVWGWYNDWFRTFSGRAQFDISEAVAARDGQVVVVARHSAQGGASGVGAEAELYYVYQVRGDRICRVEFHPSREAARTAASIDD